MKVFGNLREYEGRKHMMIFNIAELEDWNELTNHLLEVVYTHLQITRGPIPGTSQSQNVGSNYNSMTPSKL